MGNEANEFEQRKTKNMDKQPIGTNTFNNKYRYKIKPNKKLDKIYTKINM